MEGSNTRRPVLTLIVVIGVITSLMLPFHYVPYKKMIFPKDHFTFSYTLITKQDVDDLRNRYNAVSFAEKLAILQDPLFMTLTSKGILSTGESNNDGEFVSPQQTHVFNDGNLSVEIVYGSPSKREREIFGGLVPFDKVWRTGSNEATEFHTNKDLDFNNQILKAGDYSLWTKPGKENWLVFINSTIPDWGVDEYGNPAHDPKNDLIIVNVPSITVNSETEMFEISVEKAGLFNNLVLKWDKTKVVVPFKRK